jgi:uncharacterized protein (DUF58 family)
LPSRPRQDGLRWRSTRRLLRRTADLFPLTVLGMLVALAAAAVLWIFAYGAMDLVLLVVGYGALGLLGVALLTVLVTAAFVRVRLRAGARAAEGETLSMETDRVASTPVRLPSLRFVPLVRLRWGWVEPQEVRVVPERRGGDLHEAVIPSSRGRSEAIERRVVVEDVFGLTRVGLWARARAELQVLPHAGGLRRLPVLTSMAGGDELPHPLGLDDGDRVELRRYAPGDPARFIHWKVFGRTRRLMVRVPERALSRARRVVAYLVAGPGDEASAGAARVAVESGALGQDWTFGADRPAGAPAVRDASDIAEARELIVRSASARAEGGKGLSPFLGRADRAGPAAVVLFLPPEPGPWLEPVAAAIRRRAGGVHAVIGVDGLRRSKPQGWLARLLLRRSEPVAGHELAALRDVVRRLSDLRCRVSVFDRTTGRQLGEGHFARLSDEPRAGGAGKSASKASQPSRSAA